MPSLLTLYDGDDHPHQLVLKRSQVPFFCDGCKEIGFGVCYQCPDKDCDFIFHEECGIRRPPACQKFFKRCDFKFHKENPLGGDRSCDACALDIQGFLYQCSRVKNPHDLHPCCANLPLFFSFPDNDMEIYLCEEIKSKCLKCQSKKRSASKVQGLSYASRDGKFCYHVACLKEACLENWKKGYFQPDAIADDKNKSLALQNLAPKEVALVRDGGQSSNAMKVFLDISSSSKGFSPRSSFFEIELLFSTVILRDPSLIPKSDASDNEGFDKE
ncbi:uncharacterized protein LOC111297607 [Durio zibethinus]|uniref:Uncharacterized protein LOC111297607 n=1 Tax=Durio zibethinus TaxID=66656 RepID=A0A6P5Z620_DURZI|nr:uncharacterized protein LOC111297607 [Durio zibethinus]